MPIPQIKIKYNRFLDPITTFYTQNNPEDAKRGWDKWIPPTKEVLEARVKTYNDEWFKVGDKVLFAMQDILGLNFKRNVIDVYIVSGLSRAFSDPLVMKSGYSPQEFIKTLTHELIHILCSDNDSIVPSIKDCLGEGETALTRNHIIVHAVLKYLYLDILDNPKLLESNIESSQKHRTKEYSQAWEIVEKEGYLNVIKQFKEKYNR